MFSKLHIIWLVLTGKVIGESNEPLLRGTYRRTIIIEKCVK